MSEDLIRLYTARVPEDPEERSTKIKKLLKVHNRLYKKTLDQDSRDNDTEQK